LKLFKGHLSRDEIDLDNFSTPLSPILLSLKFRKEKNSKTKKISI
jgi:hypothetical protein